MLLLKELRETQDADVSYQALSPYGETLSSEIKGCHSAFPQPPSVLCPLTPVRWTFTFSAKERDLETGLSYFGARYYSSDLSIWLSVDPKASKYPSLSPYVYCANNPIKLVDPNGMEYGNPIEDALKVISDFEHSTTTSVFRNIPKSKFIEDLTQHINDPASIQQGGNGTCGAAVLSKYMAENHPVLYAEEAISLYTTGKFSHNGVSLSLPNSAFSGSMTELNELGINSVDAIMQGAFTNSQNIVFNYNPFKDGSGFKSFMYPGYFNYYVSGFLGANYHCVLSPTTEYINSLDFVNHFVVGIVHSNDYSIEGGFPNHYIQILKSGNNKMDYWTWGEKVNGSTINNSLRNGFYMIISIGL
jgi:RHS repeat-associated protein